MDRPFPPLSGTCPFCDVHIAESDGTNEQKASIFLERMRVHVLTHNHAEVLREIIFAGAFLINPRDLKKTEGKAVYLRFKNDPERLDMLIFLSLAINSFLEQMFPTHH